MYQDNGEIVIEKPKEIGKCEIAKIEILGADRLFQLVCNKELNKEYWISVRELNLHFNHAENEEVKSLVSQGAQYLTQLTSLNMTFEDGNVDPNEGLQDRNLGFVRKTPHKSEASRWNIEAHDIVPRMMPNLSEKALFQRFYDMVELKSEENPDDPDANFPLEIQEVPWTASSLTSLALSFADKNVTDEGIENLVSKGLKNLTQLRSLGLIFSVCQQITDKGVENLASQGLKNLVNLTFLELNFMACKQITDKGLESLASQGLKYLVHLTSLNLHLNCCPQITSQGAKSLAIKGLQSLTKLTSLKLNILSCSQITDEGIESLAFYGLKNFNQLRQLTMNLNYCDQITDRGIEKLASEGLRYLSQLTSLSLYCFNITDKGLNDLILHGVKNLSQLAYLYLRFPHSVKISNFSIDNIIRVLHYFGYESKPFA